MKNISILGSTGSIGLQTIDVVREYKHKFNILGLSTNQNIDLLEKQIHEFKPKAVCVMKEEKAKILKERLINNNTKVYTGINGLIEIATLENLDLMVNAVVGTIGIQPTISAINKQIDIALANKETLVSAGFLIMKLAREKGVKILPIDSEHSAIFQCIQGNQNNTISRILLTASGGPFRGKQKEDIAHITPKEALNHPTWSMGEKISIDSATLINKGLEVIEAKWLFGIEVEKIEVVIHPQSIIHSAVEYEDGAIIAQLGEKDMRVPIAYALNFPYREKNSFLKLDFITIGKLTFEKPDFKTFEGLNLAFEAIKMGGTTPAVFNAANEKAVELFLSGDISFLDIIRLIEKTMVSHKKIAQPTLEDILNSDKWAKNYVTKLVK
ncbi:1-deoxy-D-xylulose-5-phosphate reductoisomerase [Garciella nitratireducens]|uniref:1-deoxy-D-xylulose 5-phosphate reductoisomerase n=1 Tax=Garciella nitratireducens DSM 15102 TaxID=1121911 RepID=A0A1T4JX33_9FIRM|nr:1-deoxy-D-xylulose-5-phosphate reductoisomerase [Garciella nitratireducens]RBP41159.1 1-deoxy-D-xylulose 5-phosphate reductoisomerase [Garciella nitratireducens]SJZ34674.1 1-deoxy-D-xylulose 5-phosphate reductoisomerase [Garciella nitratireducens DSM 15102]